MTHMGCATWSWINERMGIQARAEARERKAGRRGRRRVRKERIGLIVRAWTQGVGH